MIRETTALPRRPRAEPELLDEMLRLLQRRRPMYSGDIVKIVKKHAKLKSVPNGIDIRLMLCKPYFKLVDTGWICTFNLPMKVERQ